MMIEKNKVSWISRTKLIVLLNDTKLSNDILALLHRFIINLKIRSAANSPKIFKFVPFSNPRDNVFPSEFINIPRVFDAPPSIPIIK